MAVALGGIVEVAGFGRLAELGMLVELELVLAGAGGLELAERELLGPAGLAVGAELEFAEHELVEPAVVAGLEAVELGPARPAGVAELEAAELVAFDVLEPVGLAGLSDLAGPALLPPAQLALENDAEHYFESPSSAKEASEAGQSPDLSLSAPYAHETKPLSIHSPPEAVLHFSAPSCQRLPQSASVPPPVYTVVAGRATRS